MRAVLINDFPLNTGIGTYTFELYKNLRQLNMDVKMYFLKTCYETSFGDVSIEVEGAPFLKSFFNFLYFPSKISSSYEVYHITSHLLSPMLIGLKNKFTIITCHDVIPLALPRPKEFPVLTYLLFKTYMKCISLAKKIVCISQYTKGEVIKYLKVPESKIRVIPYGLNHEIFKFRDKEKARKMLNLPIESKIILNVGTEESRKNVITLLKAFYKLRKKIPDVKLIRIGEMSEASRRLINELRLENLTYEKPLPQTKLCFYYNAADLFVFPSYYEGFGLPPLEAMASGCPVITTKKTSLPEVVGDAAITVEDPFDADDLSDKMYEVLLNDGLKEDLKKRGLKRAKQFSWKKCAKDHLKVYEKLE